jgi:hypothetical protein
VQGSPKIGGELGGKVGLWDVVVDVDGGKVFSEPPLEI